ncbi:MULTISPECIES: hypothetical protein [Butyricimonas]|uniref:hypothetical protein n=1 Tax=Butyricimonas TaxID=574697 RepID=UPI001D08D7EE|nr:MULTISPECIES: hypothetical protein [Butyricimonas]MCB6971843.1 hypothetical protein [Butyricimonas synergistica]MCG4518851.1 hypothetical protein [Butyricimonas sp. DFI.6.44]
MSSLQFFVSLFRKSFSCYKINVGSAILIYFAYVLVTYMSLSLVWDKFLLFEFAKQVAFAGGFSVCMAMMMGAYLPFIDTTKGDVCRLLLYFAIIVMIAFLYLYFICGSYLIWFPFSYFMGLFNVAIDSWNRKRRKAKLAL